HVDHSWISRPTSQEIDQNMGHFSVEIYASPGSTLTGNQQKGRQTAIYGFIPYFPFVGKLWDKL
ncbi:MAG TPA: hypothetical protein VJ846_05575, partial [Sphingomicrobium sp.]|nr:hypothetical protein [Sphingomicrobium sp.]